VRAGAIIGRSFWLYGGNKMISYTRFRVAAALFVAAFALGACQTISPVANTAGSPTVQLDPGTRGPVAGVGIEGQDIISMTDKMMRDMLRSRTLAGREPPPQVIIDAEYFYNESSQRLNKNAITDRLRIGLNNASDGRMIFVSRASAGMVAQERELKRQGVTDVATTGLARAQAGGDYRLTGRITSLDSRDPRSGMVQRYNQITFEMVDLERGTVVWGGIYEFARAAADDIVYR
jgi:penicillin-binding protein activator